MLDPFEVSFIAARSVSISTLEKGERKKKSTCKDPLKLFQKILKSLKGKPVLLQVESVFIQGVVKHVSNVAFGDPQSF